jgi:hypothetical protein
MSNDIVDLILNLAKQQTNTMEMRDDELVHILKKNNEELIISDTITTSKNSHPSQYGVPKWGYATWAGLYLLDMPLTEKNYWTTGGVFRDLSDDGHNGTPTNAPSWTTLGSGYKVLNFNGTTDGIDCGTDFIGLNEVTIEAWIYYNSLTFTLGEIFCNGKFKLNTFGSTMYFSSDGGAIYSISTSMPIGEWVHFIVSRFSDGTGKVYKNGVLISSGYSGNVVLGNTNLMIGSTATGDYVINGKLSGIRIYNSIQTQSQVTARYNETAALYA